MSDLGERGLDATEDSGAAPDAHDAGADGGADAGADAGAPDEPGIEVLFGGTGSGTVTSEPGDLACPGRCTVSFPVGARVTLTAMADALSRFDGWVGGGCGGTGVCALTIGAPVSVTAIFTDVSQPISVALEGTGSGTVLSNPVGIACGATCSARFLTGQPVDLVATADPGSRFAGWTGACAGQGATCTVSPAAPVEVSAFFEENRVLSVAIGLFHTCVVIMPGVVRCFGEAADGQLGYGDTTDRGDGLGPAANAADVPLNLPAGVTVTRVVAGNRHSCVLLSNGAVRCWGKNDFGQLGYGDRMTRGNSLATIPPSDVPLGADTATELTAGDTHTCVKLASGSVRCWGRGAFGALGSGGTSDVLSASGPDLAFAGAPSIEQLDAASLHTCALLSTGTVRCWGRGLFGTLGLGSEADRGDSAATVPIAGDVPLGSGTIVQLAAGISNTCVRLDSGAVRCWGNGQNGQLGRGSTAHVGDDGSDDLAIDVPVGAPVSDVAVGAHVCVRLATTGGLRCWGGNESGQLGLGDTVNRGDGIGGAPSTGDVPLNVTVRAFAVGFSQTCVITTAGALRCWGQNGHGQLGYGDRIDRGDGVGPGINSDVPIF
ncbi:hypothetical protein L6R52_28520 [Myxococcota bacterium]|nr:hypothetical protein [Myxococcota bacterium]